jgi:hypothetical protein
MMPLQLSSAPRALPVAIHPATASIDTLLGTPGPGWITGRSPHFVLHLERPARGTSVPAMLDSLETAWKRAIGLLGARVPDGVEAHVFVTASRTRFSGLLAPEARGVTTRLRRAGEIVILVRNDSVRAYVQHEVMHVASYAAWGPPPPKLVWLIEGLASFADGRCQNSTILAVGRDLLASRPGLTAEKVLDHFTDLWRSERANSYVFAGTLVDYLWASRGRTGVRRIWQGEDRVADVGPLPNAGGELTTAWRQYVGRAAGTTPGVDLNSLKSAGCG